MSERRRVCVVGSINMDLAIRCERLPQPGETVLARDAAEAPGGKGANQAVAAALQGADVAMIGRVGDDAFAARLLGNLEYYQIDTSQVLKSPRTASGLAVIGVDAAGQNAILVVSGANAKLSPDDVHAAETMIRDADVLLVQLEIPMATVEAAVKIARAAGVQILFDPAPAPSVALPQTLYEVDLLCPNQSEARSLLGRSAETVSSAQQRAGELVAAGAKFGIVTLGDQGIVWAGRKEKQMGWIEPFHVEAVDTTAAGDAFAGALAAHWTDDEQIETAIRMASAAGALAAAQQGAQAAMPTLEAVRRLMAEQHRS